MDDLMGKRAIVYIDGFNLYYGALKDGPYKWLDLEKFFVRLRQDDEIQRIFYFTAQVDGDAGRRQAAYLRALTTLPLVTVVPGKYKMKQVKCKLAPCTYAGPKWFRVPEEKRTDVHIAVQMLDDAYQDRCDRLVLVSGDSDLVPGVVKVKAAFPEKRVYVYVPSRDPTRGAAVELRSTADQARQLPLDLLKSSQFPAQVTDGSGGLIPKPATW